MALSTKSATLLPLPSSSSETPATIQWRRKEKGSCAVRTAPGTCVALPSAPEPVVQSRLIPLPANAIPLAPSHRTKSHASSPRNARPAAPHAPGPRRFMPALSCKYVPKRSASAAQQQPVVPEARPLVHVTPELWAHVAHFSYGLQEVAVLAACGRELSGSTWASADFWLAFAGPELLPAPLPADARGLREAVRHWVYQTDAHGHKLAALGDRCTAAAEAKDPREAAAVLDALARHVRGCCPAANAHEARRVLAAVEGALGGKGVAGLPDDAVAAAAERLVQAVESRGVAFGAAAVQRVTCLLEDAMERRILSKPIALAEDHHTEAPAQAQTAAPAAPAAPAWPWTGRPEWRRALSARYTACFTSCGAAASDSPTGSVSRLTTAPGSPALSATPARSRSATDLPAASAGWGLSGVQRSLTAPPESFFLAADSWDALPAPAAPLSPLASPRRPSACPSAPDCGSPSTAAPDSPGQEQEGGVWGECVGVWECPLEARLLAALEIPQECVGGPLVFEYDLDF